MEKANDKDYKFFDKKSSFGIGDDHKHLMFIEEIENADKIYYLVDCPTIFDEMENKIFFQVHILVQSKNKSFYEGELLDVHVDFLPSQKPKYTGMLTTFEETNDIDDNLYLSAALQANNYLKSKNYKYHEIEEFEAI